MDLTLVNHSVKGSAENLTGPTASAPSLSSAKITTSFKFMYPEALPVPEGVDNAEWNKAYVAANWRYI
ncbi:hypothetical protein B0O99DRAFT_605919 [Bisporella sp. PMI_857]|nr:hypothetical protein B0O99DRAFT_605919 [Bisporella sp. PMI_857]